MTPDIIWLLICAALVLFMTPGLAFFYGGLVKAKSVVSMMMLSFGAIGLVAVLWVLYGANVATLTGGSEDWLPRVIGNPFSDFGQSDAAAAAFVGGEGAIDAANVLTATAFGATFAIITTALISGAIADRARFFPWLLFAGLFATFVYFPVAGWVFAFDDEGMTGWIGNLGELIGSSASVIDFAGGTAVHINAGAAALALAIVLGRRSEGFTKEEAVPHNVPLVLIGASILWFGWFGFNTGAATDIGPGSLIFLNTIVCPAAAIIGFIVVEHFKDGKATAVGAASGAVAGLVAITPACVALTPMWALVLGLLAGAVCAFAIDLKYKFGYDDSLDVVGLHLVAGVIGTMFLGFFAIDTGLFTGGGFDQVIVQAIPVVSVAAYSFGVSFIIAKVIDVTIGFRVKEDEEVAGLDSALHGGSAYAFD